MSELKSEVEENLAFMLAAECGKMEHLALFQDLAKCLGKGRILQQAIAKGSPIETIRDIIGDGHGIAINYCEDCLELVNEMNKEVDYPLPAGMTSLMFAAKYGRTDIIECLLKLGVDVNARNNLGMTALMFACKWKKVESAELLIKAGAKVEARSNPERQYIVDSVGFTEETNDYNITDYDNTPLHFALQFIQGGRAGEGIPTSLYPSLPLVKMLLAAGANIDAPGLRGFTPLGTALSHLRGFKQTKARWPLHVDYVESELYNGIKELRAIIHLIWQKGPNIGKTVFSIRGRDEKSKAIMDCELSPEVSLVAEASMVAQAKYCLTTNDLELSDLSAYAKFIKDNMGAFTKPIFQHIPNEDRKLRLDVKAVEVSSSQVEASSSQTEASSSQTEASSSQVEASSSQTEAPKIRPSLLWSAYQMTSGILSYVYNTVVSSAGDSKTLDEQRRDKEDEHEKANFIEAMTHLTLPQGSKVCLWVHECLPCNYNVAKIVMDYHGYLPTGFHPMIDQLRKKRLGVLGWNEETRATATKDVPQSSAAASAP